MVCEVGRGRLSLDAVKTAAKGKHLIVRRAVGGRRKIAIERFAFSKIDYSGPEYRSYGSENSGHEAAHSHRDRDHTRPIGPVVHSKKRQDTGLISSFLDEVDRRCCGEPFCPDRFLHRSLATGLGK